MRQFSGGRNRGFVSSHEALIPALRAEWFRRELRLVTLLLSGLPTDGGNTYIEPGWEWKKWRCQPRLVVSEGNAINGFEFKRGRGRCIEDQVVFWSLVQKYAEGSGHATIYEDDRSVHLYWSDRSPLMARPGFITFHSGRPAKDVYKLTDLAAERDPVRGGPAAVEVRPPDPHQERYAGEV